MSYLAYSKELIKKKIYKNILQYKHILVLLPLKKKRRNFCRSAEYESKRKQYYNAAKIFRLQEISQWLLLRFDVALRP